MGVGWAWGRHSESLPPSHQVGSRGMSTGKHGLTATAAGFPNWNHLSAQIPRALSKQRGKAMSWRGGMLGCGTGSRLGGLGLRRVSSHPRSQSPSEDILSLTSGASDPGPRLSPDLVLSLTYDPEPTPTLTLNPGPRLTLSLIPDWPQVPSSITQLHLWSEGATGPLWTGPKLALGAGVARRQNIFLPLA